MGMNKLERLLYLASIDFYDDNDLYNATMEEHTTLKTEMLEALEWYEKKEKFYEMKKDLEGIITKKNLELKHVKKKLSLIQYAYDCMNRGEKIPFQMSESDRMKIQWFDERMTIGENKTIYYKPARNLAEVEKNEKKISEIMELFKDFEWTHEKAYYAMKEVARIIYN